MLYFQPKHDHFIRITQANDLDYFINCCWAIVGSHAILMVLTMLTDFFKL